MSVKGQSVLNNHTFLKRIATTKSERKKRRLLRLATNEELLSIIEIAYNVLKGRFILKTRQKHKIIPYAHVIRKISRARSPEGLRKIVQRGEGFATLPLLIAPVIFEAIRFLKNGI